VNAGGNVIVTGYSTGSGSSFDYATIKYSSAGTPLWTNRYNGPGNGYDRANAVAVGTNDSVIVTGYSFSSGNGYDYATIEYSSAGLPLWTNRCNGPGNGDDYAKAIAVDAGGNVIVTGYSTNNGTGNDYATIAYSSTGVPLWTNRYNGPANGDDRPTAIAVSSSGNVYVTGSAQLSISSPASDYATIAYSNNGVPLWTNRYSAVDDDQALAIAVDRHGNVSVTGSSSTGPYYQYNYVIATIAYTAAGVPWWTNRYNTKSWAEGIVVNQNDDVFVAGYLDFLNGSEDFATIKYSVIKPPLNFQWLGNQLVLSWTNADFGLQSAPDLAGTFTNVLGASSPYTNLSTAGQQFFRLISN
jgi:hypothetical protein